MKTLKTNFKFAANWRTTRFFNIKKSGFQVLEGIYF
jgi:hypothetical protein